MPTRGTTNKQKRPTRRIKKAASKRGRPERAQEISAATVNKQKSKPRPKRKAKRRR